MTESNTLTPVTLRIGTPILTYDSIEYLILDLDSGCDEALLLMLLESLATKANKKIIGITLTYGDTQLRNGVENTLILMKICKMRVNIYKGRFGFKAGAKENFQGFTTKCDYYGEDGLNNKQSKYRVLLGPEDYSLVRTQSAYDFISKSAITYENKLGIITTGPLTNIAIATLLNNDIPRLIGGLTSIGGSYSSIGLNAAFSSDINFNADVDASSLVLKRFRNIALIPLEFSYEGPEDKEIKDLFESDKTLKQSFIKDIFENQEYKLFGVLACLPFLAPKVIKGVFQVYGEVCREGARTKGMLSIDWLQTKEKNPKNLQILADVDWQQLVELIREALSS